MRSPAIVLKSTNVCRIITSDIGFTSLYQSIQSIQPIQKPLMTIMKKNRPNQLPDRQTVNDQLSLAAIKYLYNQFIYIN